MGLTSQQPHGLLKFLLRAPLWLYQAGLGGWLGNRFLRLTHTGRKSGQARQMVLKVVTLEPETGAYFGAIGWRGKADWFQNIHAHPAVEAMVGARTFKAIAQVVPVEEALVTFHIFSFHHRLAFRKLSRLMLGETLSPDKGGCSRLAQSVPLARLLPG